MFILAVLAALAVPAAPATGGELPRAGAAYDVDVAPSDLWSNDRVHCDDPTTPGSGAAGRDRSVAHAVEELRLREFHLGDLDARLTTTPEGSVIVPGERGRSGAGELLTFRVEVEDGLDVDPVCFALTVESILWDVRSWGGTGNASFARVDGDAYDFRIILASPHRTRRLCWPLRTGLTLSCKRHDRVVVNAWRWQSGAEAFGGDLEEYRRYLVNHEVGHILGLGHRACPGPGATAPVMMQQTKGVGGCVANGWPLPSEAPR